MEQLNRKAAHHVKLRLRHASSAAKTGRPNISAAMSVAPKMSSSVKRPISVDPRFFIFRDPRFKLGNNLCAEHLRNLIGGERHGADLDRDKRRLNVQAVMPADVAIHLVAAIKAQRGDAAYGAGCIAEEIFAVVFDVFGKHVGGSFTCGRLPVAMTYI